jgi:protein-disulfide isomerase
MHDQMFGNQQGLEDADLEKYAQAIKLDMGKYKSCMSAEKYASKMDEDQRTATRLGARGTPAFFINGRFLSGAQPFNAFAAIIDEELKKAKSSGVSKGEYYATVVEAKGKKAL